MRYFVIMMLAAGLVGCGDDGGDSGGDDAGETSQAAFDHGYGINPDAYEEGCKEVEEVPVGSLSKDIFLQDEPLRFELPAFTPCRASDASCDGVYGEEGKDVTASIEASGGYGESTFRLLRGDEVVGSQTVTESGGAPEEQWVAFEPSAGGAWTDEQFTLEVETGGAFRIDVYVTSTVYRIGEDCIEAQ